MDQPGFIATIVLAKLVCVLRGAYRYDKPIVIEVLRQVLRRSALVVEDARLARSALRQYERGAADFADHLVGEASHTRGRDTTCTFDPRAARGRHFTTVS